MKKDELKGHLSMTTANMMWGLMSPISKMVLITSIITPFIIVEIRVIGAAILFWIASIFTKRDLPERAYHKQESIGYISRCLRSLIIDRK